MSGWNDYHVFRSRFTRLCSARGVDYKTVSKKTNIAGSTIYNWLNSESMPDSESLIKISDYFGCSIDYLIGRNEHSEELNRIIDQLSVENQELVEQYAKLLALKQAHDEKNLKEAFDKIKLRITNFEKKYRFVNKNEKEEIERYISELKILENGAFLNRADHSSNVMHDDMFLCFMSGTRVWSEYCLLGKYTDFMQDINVFAAFSPFQLLIDAELSDYCGELQVFEPKTYSDQCIYVDKDGNPVEIYLNETDN